MSYNPSPGDRQRGARGRKGGGAVKKLKQRKKKKKKKKRRRRKFANQTRQQHD